MTDVDVINGDYNRFKKNLFPSPKTQTMLPNTKNLKPSNQISKLDTIPPKQIKWSLNGNGDNFKNSFIKLKLHHLLNFK